jgi:hypothetical protein
MKMMMNSERESLPMAGGCGSVCACSQEGEREQLITAGESSHFALPTAFAQQFADALSTYLVNVLGDTPCHKEDLAAHTSAFAEAFACIIGEF